MITLMTASDDIFKSTAHGLIVPVNTMGTMGNGLALAFANRFPGLEKEYKRHCRTNVYDRIGFTVHDMPGQSYRKIICLPTKRNWRFNSTVPILIHSLDGLVRHYEEYGLLSLAVPALGCGKGGLPWVTVKDLIYSYLDPLPIEVEVYPPF